MDAQAARSRDCSPIPQLPALPVVGNVPDLDTDKPVQSMMDIADQLGPIFRLELPTRSPLIVSSRELVDQLEDVLAQCKDAVAIARHFAPPLPAPVERNASVAVAERFDLRLPHAMGHEKAVPEHDRLRPGADVLIVVVASVDGDARHGWRVDV